MLSSLKPMFIYLMSLFTCQTFVLKLENNLNNSISFRAEGDGNIMPSWLQEMKAKRKIVVDKKKVWQYCNKQGEFQIQVLLNGEPTMNYLNFRDLENSERITFDGKKPDGSSKVIKGLLRIYVMELIGEVPLDTKGTSTTNIPAGASAQLQNDSARKQQIGESVVPNNHGASTPTVTFSRNDVEREREKWKHAIVGHYDGDPGDVKDFVNNQWGPGSFTMDELQSGFYLFNFSNSADKKKILWKGMWLINERHIVLKSWEPNILQDPSSFLTTLPLWVKFRNLDLQFSSEKSLEKISRSIGKLLFVDDSTPQSERFQYARVCIEVKLGADLPEKVPIRVEGDQEIEQCVEYEWKPKYCTSCCSLGHEASACALPGVEISPKSNKPSD